MEIQENLNHRKVDHACQVSIIFRDSISEPTKSFTCNRYSFKEESSDAEVQTDIYKGDIVVIPSQKMNKHKKCGTPHKEFVDASIGPDSEFSQCKSDVKNYFGGYASIKNVEQLLDLAGVTEENFDTLLEYVKPTSDHCKIHKKDRYFK
ncbi:hypothetical protein PV328_001099 [Microctonus aethiopoides]|uniref:Uncharacterized protein n=1 Tax=Microctonus aethiopoides TaxID=144406 RepID=A0AA39FW83_9HYME|nr:hypothetical protein PV328_001099 [Microctonus aethiopoides]